MYASCETEEMKHDGAVTRTKQRTILIQVRATVSAQQRRPTFLQRGGEIQSNQNKALNEQVNDCNYNG
jgi:hypothetical protein